MEDEVTYSTVVFKNGHPPTKPPKEEQTVYSEVKIKAPVAAQENTPASAPTGNKKAGHVRDFYVLSGIVVGLCLLLIVSIAVLVYLAITMTNQSAVNQQLSTQMDVLQNSTEQLTEQKRRLEAQKKQLMEQRSELEKLTQDLLRQKDGLNWTLRVIMSFDNFPVSSFCPRKQCQPCLDGWIHFKEHCYFFYNKETSWKRWDQSQSHCKNINAISDLVVIESLEEQEFIHNHTQSYFDEFHGFWIGLSNKTNDGWVWVDGQTDTLGYWMKTALGTSGPKALLIPGRPLTESWDPAENAMFNKFICESNALVKV